MDTTSEPIEKYLQRKLAAMTPLEQERLALQFSQTKKLGLIAMVLNNLKKRDKEKFEKVITEMTEVDLLFFAYAHVKNFKEKYAKMLEELAQGLYVTLEQGRKSNVR